MRQRVKTTFVSLMMAPVRPKHVASKLTGCNKLQLIAIGCL